MSGGTVDLVRGTSLDRF